MKGFASLIFHLSSLIIAGALEPVDEFGEVVEGAEACLEGFFGHGADVDVADEGGAVEFAQEGFDGDIYAYQEVVVVGVVGTRGVVLRQVGQGDAEADDVGFFVAFELSESHFGGLETVFVKDNFEIFALGLLEGDELPPVDVGGIVGECDDIAEEVEIAFGAEGEGAALGGLFADFEGEAFTIGVELLLHLVEELLLLVVGEVVEHGEALAVGEEPGPESLWVVGGHTIYDF